MYIYNTTKCSPTLGYINCIGVSITLMIVCGYFSVR